MHHLINKEGERFSSFLQALLDDDADHAFERTFADLARSLDVDVYRSLKSGQFEVVRVKVPPVHELKPVVMRTLSAAERAAVEQHFKEASLQKEEQ